MRRYAGLVFFASFLLAFFVTALTRRFAGSKILGIVTNNLWPRPLRAGRTKLRSAFSLADQPRATKSHPGRPKKNERSGSSEALRNAVYSACVSYALPGTGAGGASDSADAPPLTSPTLKREKRRMEMFSPSLAIAWLIISPIVRLSSLI